MTAESVDGLIERLRAWVRRSTQQNGEDIEEAAAALSRLQRERDEYKIWWERDSTSLGKMIADRDAQRVYAEDFRALAATRLVELQEQQRLVEGLFGGRTYGGWKLVPAEPTGEMVDAGIDTDVGSDPDDNSWSAEYVWRAMFDATPKPDRAAIDAAIKEKCDE